MTRAQDTAVMLKFSAHTLDELPGPLRALAQNGYAIVPDFLSPAVTTALLAECQDLYNQGKTHTAGIGQGSRHRVLPTVRTDQIVWLDSADLTPAQTIYWQAMEDLRQCLNRAYFLGLVDYECHYAYYPAGGYYKRHRDAFQGTNRRRISSVFYMNFDGTAADGGQLRLFVPDDAGHATVDIPPVAGTLVIFDSQTMEHEVLPTQAIRHSLAGWLRTA